MKSRVSISLMTLLTSLACQAPETINPPPLPTPIPVRTFRVGVQEEGRTEVPGTVEAAHKARLASRLSALVEEIPVEEGDRVTKGSLLVRLDGRDVEARRQGAEAAYRAARAQHERVSNLYLKEAATKQELDAAEAAAAGALAERDAVLVQLQYVEIRAPFDGWVTDKSAQPGDLAGPGQVLLTIQGAGLMRVAATVAQDQAESLEMGQALEVVKENGSSLSAPISVLSPAGDPASRRFLVKVDLPADSGARAGSFWRLRLPAGTGESLLLIPRSALVERGALTGVYVVRDGRAWLRWISPGREWGGSVSVRSGLDPGEEVVLEPGGLSDGAPVKPLALAEEPPR